MRLDLRHDIDKSLLIVSSAENCDTDSWPLVPEVELRHYRSTPDPEIGAIAAAILFARHCGSVAEFAGGGIGLDAARAIRTILPDLEELLFPIDKERKDISQGTAVLVVGEARRIVGSRVAIGEIGRAVHVITWSGDFVAADRRHSTDHIGGDVFTNARLVAGSSQVSVALALLSGGKDVRDIYIPSPPADEGADFRRIAEGLEFVGIKLRSLKVTSAPAKAA